MGNCDRRSTIMYVHKSQGSRQVLEQLTSKSCLLPCRQYVSECARQKGTRQCPEAWSLTTTDDMRTHLSFFDIVPSAIDGKRSNESAMFLNHDLLGMFKAMAAHKSQSRW